MKIELKNLKINEAFSEETTCFMADVFVNGKKVAHARNDGRGGCTFIHAYPNQHELVAQAEKFCSELPKQVIDFGDRTHEFAQTLDSVILRAGKTKRFDTNKLPIGNTNRAFVQVSNFDSTIVSKKPQTLIKIGTANQQIKKMVEWEVQN